MTTAMYYITLYIKLYQNNNIINQDYTVIRNNTNNLLNHKRQLTSIE